MSTSLRPNQFGLSALLATVTVVACVCSMAKVYHLHAVTAGAVAAAVLLWILLVANRRFWMRFAATLALMTGANFLPLALTWKAYRGDGFETIGWPFVISARGGFSYVELFFPEHLAFDIATALAAAVFVAIALRNGWRGLYCRVRVWGIEHLEPDAPPNDGEEVGTDHSKGGCVSTLALLVFVMMLTVAAMTVWDWLNQLDASTDTF